MGDTKREGEQRREQADRSCPEKKPVPNEPQTIENVGVNDRWPETLSALCGGGF